jgi:hypothetical protein
MVTSSKMRERLETWPWRLDLVINASRTSRRALRWGRSEDRTCRLAVNGLASSLDSYWPILLRQIGCCPFCSSLRITLHGLAPGVPGTPCGAAGMPVQSRGVPITLDSVAPPRNFCLLALTSGGTGGYAGQAAYEVRPVPGDDRPHDSVEPEGSVIQCSQPVR